MTDIARQTVEFLYEENGGMPRDLHLPTIDDIKEDLAKFTIDRVRKGTTVIIRDPKGTGATTLLPKYAVRSMLKTFGLTGTVLDIDNVGGCENNKKHSFHHKCCLHVKKSKKHFYYGKKCKMQYLVG